MVFKLVRYPVIREWCHKDICKEIGAPKQSLPGENSMHPIDTTIMEHCPSLPVLDFVSAGFLCHVTDTDLSWWVQFSLPWHSQTAGSWGFTHLLKTTALPLLWAPYSVSHFDLVLLKCYTKLALGYFTGCFLSQSSSLFFILTAEFSFCLYATHHLWLLMYFFVQFLTSESDSVSLFD